MTGLHDDVWSEQLISDFPSVSDKAVCWKSLTEDSGCAVALLDDQGVYLFANTTATTWVGKGLNQICGRRFADLFPAPFAQERLEIMRRTLETGISHLVIGMVRGSWNHMTIRRVFHPGDSSGFCVLTVCRAVLLSEQSC